MRTVGKIGLVGVAWMVGMLGGGPAYAGPLDLSLYPPITEIIATPDSSLSAPITLSNNSEKTQKISFNIKPLAPFKDEAILKSLFTITKNQQSLDNPFQLRPSETANLSLTIEVPKEASPSDYYSTLIFQAVNEEQPSSSESGAFSKIEIGIGTNVLLSIRTDLSNLSNSIIKEFSAGLFYFGQPVKPVLVVENQGLHFVKAKGEIVITDVNGGQIKKIDIPVQNILAGTSRNIAEKIAAISTQNLFGKYDATATIEVDGKKTLVTHFTFYAIPKTGGGIITVIMIIIIIVINRLQSYRKISRFGRR